jgi:hypothetical protein
MKKTGFGKVKNLPPGHYKRAGIIPYKITEGTVQFAFGVDRESGDISNFGGSLRPPENAIDAAIREFEEESLGVFEQLSRSKVESSCVLYSPREIMIFIKSDWEDDVLQTDFKQKASRHSEMEKIVFYNYKDLIQEIEKEDDIAFYEPVSSLLLSGIHENSNFLQELTSQ